MPCPPLGPDQYELTDDVVTAASESAGERFGNISILNFNWSCNRLEGQPGCSVMGHMLGLMTFWPFSDSLQAVGMMVKDMGMWSVSLGGSNLHSES